MRPMEIRKMSSRVSQAKTVDYISEPSENPGPTAYRVCGILPCEEQYSFTLLFRERSLLT